MRIEDSDSEDKTLPTQTELMNASGVPPRWNEEPLIIRQFIDDMSGTEKIPISSGIMTVSQSKQQVEVHAEKSQAFYKTVAANVTGVGMKMNGLKTQLLCFSTAINYEVRSFICVEGQKIVSGDDLKLLGYHFGRRPRPDAHIKLSLIHI